MYVPPQWGRGMPMTEQYAASKPRNFLVVVDDTPESRVALRFAARRALGMENGGVMLLRVVSPPDFNHWMGVKEIMRAEARQEAEDLLADLVRQVEVDHGLRPQTMIREGALKDEVLAEIEEDSTIRIVMLGAAPDGGSPGPLVEALAGELSGSLRIPVTVVPGSLSSTDVDQLT